MEELILNFEDNEFVEKYDIYQVAIEKFEELKDDVEILQNYLNDGITLEEIKEEEKRIEFNKNKTIKDWYITRILSKELILKKYFENEFNSINELKNQIDVLESEIKDIFESIDEEDKTLSVFKENGFDNKELAKLVKTLNQNNSEIENNELKEKLIEVDNKNNELTTLKNTLKVEEAELLTISLNKYNSLNENEFYDLLFFKWTNDIPTKLEEKVNKVIDSLIEKIEHIFNKYSDTLNEINNEISKNEMELVNLLSELKADEYDKKAIDELINILNGDKNGKK